MRRMLGFRALAALLVLCLIPAGAPALGTEMAANAAFGDYGRQAYAYLAQIDRDYPQRSSTDEAQSAAIQDWIVAQLEEAGCAPDWIDESHFMFQAVFAEDFLSENIVATLPGETARQVIIGAHYDGAGMGDNGSGVALLLETARDLIARGPLPYTVVFVFFGAEEKGMFGSQAYVDNLSDGEVADTLFYVNVDSIVCGDECYLYGGVPDFENRRVTQTEAYERFAAEGARLGLPIRAVPWTFERPAPGFSEPAYPSPSTGPWADYVAFRQRGIPYVYFEATNWDLPGPKAQYDGRIETAEAGAIMHTPKDQLATVESLFPGRVLYHLQVYSTLLHTVLYGL